MSAVQFFENKNQVKIKFPEVKRKKLTENITLNYQIMTFLTQDIMVTMEHLEDKGVFKRSKIYNYLQKLSDKDSDYMHEVYKKNNRADQYMNDYESVIGYFKSLSSKLLSDYQKTTDNKLEDILFVITAYEFVLSSATFVALEFGSMPEYKIINNIKNELEKIKSVFDSRYSKVSNFKFEHGQFKSLFEKIKYCSQKQFLGLIDDTLK